MSNELELLLFSYFLNIIVSFFFISCSFFFVHQYIIKAGDCLESPPSITNTKLIGPLIQFTDFYKLIIITIKCMATLYLMCGQSI